MKKGRSAAVSPQGGGCCCRAMAKKVVCSERAHRNLHKFRRSWRVALRAILVPWSSMLPFAHALRFG